MAKRKPRRKRLDDAAWIRRHFEELVDKYAGKYAVVAEGELFVGYDARQLDEAARRKHPGIIPHGLRIPRPEDFTCAL
mgnify:CR=1 FL=1